MSHPGERGDRSLLLSADHSLAISPEASIPEPKAPIKARREAFVVGDYEECPATTSLEL